MRPIYEVGERIGLREDDLIPYGRYKAKVKLHRLFSPPISNPRYILVSAMTPTKSGEGKTTTTIGLSMAFNRFKGRAVACIRQPSLGPYLGVKGGGTGGGRCRVLPEEDINLHFTGDNYAVSTAHNFISSLLDNHLFRGNQLDIDISTINWPRAVDVSDAALREVIVGLNWDKKSRYFPHKGQFCITAASELMSILALSWDEEDFKKRIGEIVLAFSDKGEPIRLRDLGGLGAVWAMMREALMPNLVQASDGTPVFIHSGPFANISIGASSIIADRLAMNLADYVITEAGFGMDCGGEKFINIKSRLLRRSPDCVVIVATLKAVKEYGQENLARHIRIAKQFGLNVVVLVNAWEGEDGKKLEALTKFAIDSGADKAFISQFYSQGSELGQEIVDGIDDLIASRSTPQIQFTYEQSDGLAVKLEKLSRDVYGASGVAFEPIAKEKLDLFSDKGFSSLLMCVAKTQFSFGHRVGFQPDGGEKFLISDVFLSAGAGFVVAVAGSITTLPGLPSRPRALNFAF